MRQVCLLNGNDVSFDHEPDLVEYECWFSLRSELADCRKVFPQVCGNCVNYAVEAGKRERGGETRVRREKVAA